MVRGFLLFFLTIAILILPVSAVSFDNNVAVASSITFSAWYGDGLYNLPVNSMSGQTDIFWINNTLPFNITDCYMEMFLDVQSTASFYLVLSDRINISNGNTINYFFYGLDDYRVSSKDVTFTYYDNSYYKYDIYNFDSSTEEFMYNVNQVSNPIYTSFSVHAYRFENVPYGTYSIEVYDESLISNNGVYSDKNFFVYGLYVTVPTALTEYENGNISFEDAVDQITSETNNALNSAGDDTAASQLAIAVGQWELDQLANLSDEKSLSNYHDFSVRLNYEIEKFNTGSQDLSTTLSKFNNYFSQSLDSSESIAQGVLINSLYQFKLNLLEFFSKIKAKATLDNAISDEEMQFTQDYYESESQIMAKFDIQKYRDALTFYLWENQLDISERSTYKSYFDFLIKSDVLNFFIAIPITMVIISIILGTRIRLPRSRESSVNVSSDGKVNSNN